MSSPNSKVSFNEATMINDLINDLNDDNEMDDVRHMNDSTLPKARTPTTTTSSFSSLTSKTTTLQNPSSSISSTSRISRNHKALRPGFGLGDWTRLLQSSRNLAQRNQDAPLRRDITREEVAQHCYEYDAWIILYGKVYNISPYLPYHPGGIKILKSSLGKDATALFEKYHRWVNVEGLIGPLILGYLDLRSSNHDDDDEDNARSYLVPHAVSSRNQVTTMPPPPSIFPSSNMHSSKGPPSK